MCVKLHYHEYNFGKVKSKKNSKQELVKNFIQNGIFIDKNTIKDDKKIFSMQRY